MKTFLKILILCSINSILLVSGLQCYVCDSTDLNYGEYNYCDTRYCEENVGYLETCEDVELTDENVNQADLVCYRTVFFHKDDGYVIMRGCSTKNICSVLQQNATALDNDAIAIPTECQTCNEDFCDPQQSSDGWFNDCHVAEHQYISCEEREHNKCGKDPWYCNTEYTSEDWFNFDECNNYTEW